MTNDLSSIPDSEWAAMAAIAGHPWPPQPPSAVTNDRAHDGEALR
jgi:hypothetical protein